MQNDLKKADWKQTPFYIVAWLVSVVLMAIDLVFVREIVTVILTAIGLAKATAHPETWAFVRLDLRLDGRDRQPRDVARDGVRWHRADDCH